MFFFQAEDGIRDLVRSRGLGDVYKRQPYKYVTAKNVKEFTLDLSNITYVSEEDHKAIFARAPVKCGDVLYVKDGANTGLTAINLSLIHI